MWAAREKTSQDITNNENLTLLGKGTDFKGVVSYDGTVRIDGQVEGEVYTTGTLIVGEEGIIKGKISAGIVTISGKIRGTVTAAQKIEILHSGKLIGDIQAPTISIQEGAQFHGSCDMGVSKGEEDQASPDSNVLDLTTYRGLAV